MIVFTISFVGNHLIIAIIAGGLASAKTLKATGVMVFLTKKIWMKTMEAIDCFSYQGYEFSILKYKTGVTAKLFKDGKWIFTKLFYGGSRENAIDDTEGYVDRQIGKSPFGVVSKKLSGKRKKEFLNLMAKQRRKK